MAERNGVTTELVGFDFSKEVLEQTKEKNFYVLLIEADSNNPLPRPDGSFDCFAACALFIASHCGPSCCRVLSELLNLVASEPLVLDTTPTWKKVRTTSTCSKIGLQSPQKNLVGHYLGPVDTKYLVQKTE